MSKFSTKCSVEGYNFKKEPHWENAARGGVILHLYQTEDKGHGSKGSHPEENFEIQVERIDEE